MRIPQAAAARDEAGPGPAGYVNTVMSPAGGLLAEVGDGVCVPVTSSGVSVGTCPYPACPVLPVVCCFSFRMSEANSKVNKSF